jgi:hypothetical protein
MASKLMTMQLIQNSMWEVHSFKVGKKPYSEFKIGDMFFCPSGFYLYYQSTYPAETIEIANDLKKVFGVYHFDFIDGAGSAWNVLS